MTPLLILMVSWMAKNIAMPYGTYAIPAWPSGQISIWGLSQTFSGGYTYGQMLDTFDNHIQIQANTNITVGVMTQQEFSTLVFDVSHHANYPYNTIAFYNGTKIDFWFNLSTGCDGYIYVIYNDDYHLGGFSVNPNVTATYNPSKSLTGICG